jgi:hypothetical protein
VWDKVVVGSKEKRMEVWGELIQWMIKISWGNCQSLKRGGEVGQRAIKATMVVRIWVISGEFVESGVTNGKCSEMRREMIYSSIEIITKIEVKQRRGEVVHWVIKCTWERKFQKRRWEPVVHRRIESNAKGEFSEGMWKDVEKGQTVVWEDLEWRKGRVLVVITVDFLSMG